MLKRSLDRAATLYVPLLVAMLFTLLPFYWTIITSLKHEVDITRLPIQYLPSPFTFENYKIAWDTVGFSIFFKNSLFVSLSTVVIVLVLSVLTGYALSRFQFRGKRAFLLLLLCTQFIPGAMLLIPLFMIFKTFGMISNPLSLIITYSTFQLPFNSILMSGFVTNIPEQLEEAAMVDGCSRLKAVFLVIFPILLPGIVATTVFTFIGAWNEFLFGLMLINKPQFFTLPIGLRYMQGEYNMAYGALAAGSVISLLPVVVLFAFVQKYMVQGMSAGAVKG
ncbi:carbohydrate ABC transporter permease [Paenibacillus rigui]|uniref:Transporter n=1 Tax=Paenibacillus rigui TaxID=554312 RepID=A0A229UU06_9BACL|nr:carbohydrate ABC transporter permease [Paenibacillus rigui]OXM86741.1 transporter [Paenibacillus rigui]